MAEDDWTKNVRKALKNIGDGLDYDTSRSNRDFPLGSLKIRPDVIWEKAGKIKCIFEIDRGAHGSYPKTIYGSMFTGILASIQEKCKFIEVIRRIGDDKINAEKVKQIKEIYDKGVDDKRIKIPKFDVLYIGNKPSNPSAYGQTQYEMTSSDGLKSAVSRVGNFKLNHGA